MALTRVSDDRAPSWLLPRAASAVRRRLNYWRRRRTGEPLRYAAEYAIQSLLDWSAEGQPPELIAEVATVLWRFGERDAAVQKCAPAGLSSSAELPIITAPPACPDPAMIGTSVEATLAFLRDLQQFAVASFTPGALPETIAENDGRLTEIRSQLTNLAPGMRVLDAGCGSGRFLARLTREFPKLWFAGADPSSALLAQAPECVERKQGILTCLPWPDATFDLVFAVESLEHSLHPSGAVRELCRVTKPGGHIAINDKNASFQPLSECEPWERWFAPAEVTEWLAHDCDSIQVERIPHGSHSEPTGLFLCWTACRRSA